MISTAEDWNACVNPAWMLRHLRGKILSTRDLSSWLGHPSYGIVPRKWRLFLAACAWRVVPLLGQAAEPAARLMEFADGLTEQTPTAEARARVLAWFETVGWNTRVRCFTWGLTNPVGMAAGELRNVAGHAARAAALKSDKEAAQRRALDAEEVAQCELLRCIFGNPFRPVVFDSTWLTPTAVALATGTYLEKAFDRIPILADAFEEAGCDNVDVLNHCRGAGPHVRGCWVVDQVLGKE